MPSEPLLSEDASQLDAAIDQAIAACDGDLRTTIGALIVANNFLEKEVEELMKAVSHAYSKHLLVLSENIDYRFESKIIWVFYLLGVDDVWWVFDAAIYPDQFISVNHTRNCCFYIVLLDYPVKPSGNLGPRRLLVHLEIRKPSFIQLSLPFVRKFNPSILSRDVAGQN